MDIRNLIAQISKQVNSKENCSKELNKYNENRLRNLNKTDRKRIGDIIRRIRIKLLSNKEKKEKKIKRKSKLFQINSKIKSNKCLN